MSKATTVPESRRQQQCREMEIIDEATEGSADSEETNTEAECEDATETDVEVLELQRQLSQIGSD